SELTMIAVVVRTARVVVVVVTIMAPLALVANDQNLRPEDANIAGVMGGYRVPLHAGIINGVDVLLRSGALGGIVPGISLNHGDGDGISGFNFNLHSAVRPRIVSAGAVVVVGIKADSLIAGGHPVEQFGLRRVWQVAVVRAGPVEVLHANVVGRD